MPIRMLVSDVDGTLLAPDKSISAASRRAIAKLHAVGIQFTVISGRPPRGMQFLVDPLGLTHPMAALNGAMILWPNLSLLQATTMNPAVAAGVADIIRQHELELWLYTISDWLVSDPQSPHVRHEVAVVQHEPALIADGGQFPPSVTKVLGVSDDHPRVRRCEAAVLQQFSNQVSASRSQPHYLDVTAPSGDKGHGLAALSTVMGIELESIAVIGDGPNDIPMFHRAGLSIAMGNADQTVRQAARHVTDTNSDDGFAQAVERFILPAAK
jgi:Cof subfamily protein (haloacid dehalogenase superfamily)